jgi:pimeloyl-ACP methyl ester carboxylesterase
MTRITAATLRRGRIDRRLAAAVIGILALVLALQLAVAGSARSATRTPKPTVVLVHGAWADSSAWDGVIRDLDTRGYTVDAFPTPLVGLMSDAETLADYVKAIPGPVVLVGHSYGGAVITNAATGLTNVKSLVYVDAFAPAQGESTLQLATAKPGSALGGDPATVFNAVPYAGAPTGDVDLYVKPSVFPSALANDLPASEARMLATTQRPITFSAFATPSGPPAWAQIPSWFLIGTADHAIPPAEQLAMAERAGSHIVRVNASHLSMVSQPQAVASIIESAAR